MALAPGTAVRSVDNPAREGVVTSTPPRERPSGTAYQVRWADGLTDFVKESELESIENLDTHDPYSAAEKGRYGRALDLRRNLTYAHLSGRLANLVYSLGVTDTDFYPHQYRPLLTLLDSPTNGLLIADEVGLGKTIEAGLIWTEFRARFDMRQLLVVCPAALREKWRDELRNRFGLDARIVDAKDLLEELSSGSLPVGEGRAWITSYQAVRPPKDWSANARTPERPSSKWKLASFLESKGQDEPILDLVVYDEAHYMRNTETASWQLAELIRDVTVYQVMLSATPINLRNEDLFNLLRLLDPDHFGSHEDFAQMLETNRPLVAARDAALNTSGTLEALTSHLIEASQQPLLRNSKQLAAILEDPPSAERLLDRSYRAELADSLERMNLLGHVVTRTRKRDVPDRHIKREVKREAVPMNPLERRLYEAVTEATRSYAWSEGISDGFLLAMPQRQVTSCPAAVARAWSQGMTSTIAEDLLIELEDDSDEDAPSATLRDLLAATVIKDFDVDALERDDSKFNRFLEVAKAHLRDHPTEKLIVFTTFRATAAYLKRRLESQGLPASVLWGGESRAKQELIDEFRESTSLRVLISTEVASEGVDLQFCRVLVNYDLPWNPTRIEQRIGRIDRLGQTAPLIHIWNLYFAETIDERVVVRLFDRLRVFEETLGETGAAIGDAVRKLESELLRRNLTPQEEEQEIARTAQALESIRLRQEELEKNAAHMMAHGQRIMERVANAKELSKRVTEADLHTYVGDYLEKYAKGFRFVQEGTDRYLVSIQLPPDLASKLDQFMNAEGLAGRSALGSGQMRKCRFLNKISQRAKPGEEIVHQFHPLVRFISKDLRVRNEHFYPLVAVSLRADPAAPIPASDYAFFCRTWAFGGVREEEILASVVIDLRTGLPLDDDVGESLVQRARLDGSDWIAAGSEIDSSIVRDRFEEAEELLDQRFQALLTRKREENADRAEFQLQSIDQHLERRIPRLHETLRGHHAAGRSSLAKAIQAQISKLEARMAVRKEKIRESEKVTANKNLVCAGLIRII